MYVTVFQIWLAQWSHFTNFFHNFQFLYFAYHRQNVNTCYSSLIFTFSTQISLSNSLLRMFKLTEKCTFLSYLYKRLIVQDHSLCTCYIIWYFFIYFHIFGSTTMMVWKTYPSCLTDKQSMQTYGALTPVRSYSSTLS